MPVALTRVEARLVPTGDGRATRQVGDSEDGQASSEAECKSSNFRLCPAVAPPHNHNKNLAANPCSSPQGCSPSRSTLHWGRTQWSHPGKWGRRGHMLGWLRPQRCTQLAMAKQKHQAEAKTEVFVGLGCMLGEKGITGYHVCHISYKWHSLRSISTRSGGARACARASCPNPL